MTDEQPVKKTVKKKVLRIVFTQEEKKVARRNIENFRQSYIIDTKEMILEYDYQAESKIFTPQDFIIQQEIEKKLRQAMNNKKSKQVVYFHYQLNSYLIKNIRNFFTTYSTNFEFVLFDPDSSLVKIHKYFDEVLP